MTIQGKQVHQELNFGKLLEPGLRKIFYETYDEIPEQYSKVFHVKTSKKAQEREYGLGAMPVWNEFGSSTSAVSGTNGMPTVPYVTLDKGLERVYTHKEFAQGFMVERKFVDDEMYGVIEKMPKDLARSGRYKVEMDAAAIFDNAFTDNGYDSVPLCASNHPLVAGGTCSNLIEGELSVENLKKAITMLRNVKDEGGKKVVYKATTLIVPPALEFKAREILNSQLIADSESNNANSLKGMLDIIVLDFLTSDTAWFVVDKSRHELKFFWRVKMEFKRDEDFDTLVAKYRGYCRYSLGYSDWRGVVGSKGTSTYALSKAKTK